MRMRRPRVAITFAVFGLAAFCALVGIQLWTGLGGGGRSPQSRRRLRGHSPERPRRRLEPQLPLALAPARSSRLRPVLGPPSAVGARITDRPCPDPEGATRRHYLVPPAIGGGRRIGRENSPRAELPPGFPPPPPPLHPISR